MMKRCNNTRMDVTNKFWTRDHVIEPLQGSGCIGLDSEGVALG